MYLNKILKEVNEETKIINIVKSDEETKWIASENELTTLRHAFNILNQIEVLDLIEQNGYSLNKNVIKASELEKILVNDFKNGLLNQKLYEDIREKAFNPELNVSDGFFLSFENNEIKITSNLLIKQIADWNTTLSEENGFDSNIDYINFRNNVCKLSVTRNSEKFAYDKRSMFSTTFVDEHKLLVEIDFKTNIIYFQTSNSTKYRSIKTVVKLFLSILLDKEGKFKLLPPKMSQKLNFTFSKNNSTAIAHNNISPNTIKLLDLLLGLEDSGSNFNELICVDITFDHEDTKAENLKAKIDRQGFGGEDLLRKSDIKQHILNNRGILQIVFKLTYTEELADDRERKHVILAGIDNDTKNHVRIYIQNNNPDLKRVVNKAHKDLKNIFIEHSSSSSLRNEDKIKQLLGL